MATLRERILELLALRPGLSDREVTDQLSGRSAPQQPINTLARRLEQEGQLERQVRADGRIGNYPFGGSRKAAPTPKPPVAQPTTGFLSEDEVKQKLEVWLARDGWKVVAIMGRQRGIDLEARRGTSRWVIEVKGQGKYGPMRVNYFLCVLGEILQRMVDPQARYSIAFPDHLQFRGLWQRLPAPAKERTQISALFVADAGHVEEVK